MSDRNKFVQWFGSGFMKNLEQIHQYLFSFSRAILLAVVGSLFIPSIDLSAFQTVLGLGVAISFVVVGFVVGTYKPNSDEGEQ